MKKTFVKARNIEDIVEVLRVFSDVPEVNKLSHVINKWFGEEVIVRLKEFRSGIYFVILYVVPEMRGTGLADEVVKEILSYADYAGKAVFGTPAPKKNSDVVPLPSLQRFYERVGFRKTTEEEHERFGHEYIYVPVKK